MKAIKAKREVLTPSDFENFMFDVMAPRVRTFNGKKVIEGVTRTDQFKVIGYTYYPTNGQIEMKNEDNETKFSGVIRNVEDFNKALKKADKK